MFEKSATFRRTVYQEDIEMFEHRLAMVKSFIAGKKVIKNQAQIERIENFIKTYKPISGKKSNIIDNITYSARNEFLSHLYGVQDKLDVSDSKLFKYLEDNKLIDNKDFWQQFFNSPYFSPMYTHYRGISAIDVLDNDNIINENVSKQTLGSIQGEMLYSFATMFVNEGVNKGVFKLKENNKKAYIVKPRSAYKYLHKIKKHGSKK